MISELYVSQVAGCECEPDCDCMECECECSNLYDEHISYAELEEEFGELLRRSG